MASPIFLSRPHSGFSWNAFEVGLRLAVWSLHRFASSFTDFCSRERHALLKVCALTLATRLVVFSLRQVMDHFPLMSLAADSMDLLLACYGLSRFAYPEFKRAFWSSFHSNFNDFENKKLHSEPGPSLYCMLFSLFRSNFMWLISLLLLSDFMVTSAQVGKPEALTAVSKTVISIMLLTLWTSHMSPALGSLASLAVGGALTASLAPFSNLALLLRLWQLQFLVEYLMVPYVSQARFSPTEYAMWLKVRGGVICGFSTFVYVLLSLCGPNLMSPLLVFILAPLFANLMSKIAEPVPANIIFGTKAYSRWCARQILWIERKRCLQAR